MKFTEFSELKKKLKSGSCENVDFLLEIVDCVQNYTGEQIEQIKNRIEQTLYEPEKSFGKVITVLADEEYRERLKSADFYEIDDTLFYLSKSKLEPTIICANRDIIAAKKEGKKSITLGYTFLKCDYKRFRQLTEQYDTYKGCIRYKDGKKTEICYQLVFSDRLIQKEKILKYCGELYGITAPIVFLPLARRLVEVQINVKDIEDYNEDVQGIDLRLEENDLNEIISLNKFAAWNIRMLNQDLDISRSRGNPLGEERHYSCVFDGCGRNQYIIPLVKKSFLFDSPRRDRDKIEFKYLETYTGGFAKITVNSILKEPETLYFFSNSHKANDSNGRTMEQLIKPRLRSEADILTAVRQHGEQLGLEFERISGTKLSDYKDCEKYRNELSYTTVDKILLKKTGTVYLYFANKENSIFADDYINYLCDYFTVMYPDITWRGGYR